MEKIGLTFLLCPLCGRMVSRRHFSPQALDLDIYVQEVKGLENGRGFAAVGRRSILGPSETVFSIKGRVLDLARMLYDEGLLHQDEIAGRFSFPRDHRTLEEGHDALRANLGETKEKYIEAGPLA